MIYGGFCATNAKDFRRLIAIRDNGVPKEDQYKRYQE